MGECAAAICIALFFNSGETYSNHQKIACQSITRSAMEAGLSGPGVASLAWHESRFIHSAKSSAGAIGALQVLPRYWCKNGKRARCNLVDAGLRAYEYYMKHSKTFRDGICKYNSGRVCSRSKSVSRYAIKVERLMKIIKEEIAFSACSEDGC
jgi:hypothetical protein